MPANRQLIRDRQYNRDLCSYLAQFLTDNRKELLLRQLQERTRHLTVVIEDIYQQHNASACIRSCDCFGIQDVHLIENRNEFIASKDVALGASQWLTMHRYNDASHQPDSTSACLQQLKTSGYQIVMTSPHNSDCDLETYDISHKTALVFGNEKEGASETVRQHADHVMRIPMYGFTESFNISVAVAVCLHHLVWRMRQLDIDWQLPVDQRDDLLLHWVRASNSKRLQSLERRFRETQESADGIESIPLWPDWDALADIDT